MRSDASALAISAVTALKTRTASLGAATVLTQRPEDTIFAAISDDAKANSAHHTFSSSYYRIYWELMRYAAHRKNQRDELLVSTPALNGKAVVAKRQNLF